MSFSENPKINYCFLKLAYPYKTLNDLMSKIDKNCVLPAENETEDEKMAPRDFFDEFVASLQQLWVSKRFADFIITALHENKPQEFKVHTLILKMQSSVLEAAVDDDMKEKNNGKMHIKDFSAETVEDFLHFLYTGEVQADNAMDLFAIATKYEVKLLREHSETIVVSSIDHSNAIDVFCLGHLYHSEKMKVSAFNEIKNIFNLKDLDDSLLDDPETLSKLIEAVKMIRDGHAGINKLKISKEKKEAVTEGK